MLKFEFNGTKYAIDFTHPIEVEKKGGKNVTHRTTKCELLINTSSVPTRTIFSTLSDGYSYCHPNDKFDKEIGRKKALKAALDEYQPKHGKDFRKAAWDCYFNRKNTFENPISPESTSKEPVKEPVSKFSTNYIPSEQPNYWIKVGNLEVAKYPVTVRDYEKFLNATFYEQPNNWQTQLETPYNPVVNISWNDANAYCNWSGTRLPTEEEWLRIAYGEKGNQRKYPWGNDERENFGNFWDNGPHKTVSVYKYSAFGTPEGIVDLLGNVMEWTSTAYENYSGGYVLRGGSWYNLAANVRVSNRSWISPGARLDYQGFRCVRDLAPNLPLEDMVSDPKDTAENTPNVVNKIYKDLSTEEGRKIWDMVNKAASKNMKNSSEPEIIILKKFTSILEQTSSVLELFDLFLFCDLWSTPEYRQDLSIAIGNIVTKEEFRKTYIL